MRENKRHVVFPYLLKFCCMQAENGIESIIGKIIHAVVRLSTVKSSGLAIDSKFVCRKKTYQICDASNIYVFFLENAWIYGFHGESTKLS